MTLPSSMKALVLERYDPDSLSVATVPLPELTTGQVLVRMVAAPINPSDLVFLKDMYGVHKRLPVVPGFEGAGTVVASNAGLFGRWLVGKRVAVRAPEDGNGTWAEYMACEPGGCIPLRSKVSTEAGAMLIVNPLTAWCLLAWIERERHPSFMQTAAASALGRMIDRLARRRGLPCINIVRRREQAELLRKEGARFVLDSSEPGFESQLKALCDQERVTIALDAVGGSLTKSLVNGMARGGKVIVYGALSGEPSQVNGWDLVFEGKSLQGFWLTQWVHYMSPPAKWRMVWRVQDLVANDLRTEIHARYPLDRFRDAIDDYKKNRTQGKVLLRMDA